MFPFVQNIAIKYIKDTTTPSEQMRPEQSFDNGPRYFGLSQEVAASLLLLMHAKNYLEGRYGHTVLEIGPCLQGHRVSSGFLDLRTSCR